MCQSNHFSLRRANRSLGISTWTMSHSFYAVMGGFVERTVHRDKNVMIGYLRPVHPDEFSNSINTRFRLPKISEDEIQDKSKADNLTKTIAVCQLLWFSVQLIGRLLKGWAATELEVVTFGTCIITVVIYFFWWNKLLDVRCQTFLDTTDHQPGVAQQYHAVIQATESSESKRLPRRSDWMLTVSFRKARQVLFLEVLQFLPKAQPSFSSQDIWSRRGDQRYPHDYRSPARFPLGDGSK